MLRTLGSAQGFSLIELMVAMAIGSIILLLIGGLMASSGDSYERIGGSIHAEREARAAFTQITADLASAKFHPDSIIENSTAAWPKDRLGILSLQAPDAQTKTDRIGDLCAIHYYVKDLTIAGNTIRCLMRGFRDSTPTFEALRNNTVPALFTSRDPIDEPIAFGVVSFTAKPKIRGSNGQLIDWVESQGAAPDLLDVSLIIARRDLAGRLKKPADWDGAGNILGDHTNASKNRNLEIYNTLIRYGHEHSR